MVTSGQPAEASRASAASIHHAEEPVGPALHVALADLIAQAGHPLPAFVAMHLDGRHDRLFQGLVVVRIDEHGIGQFVGGTGELRQHEHAVAVDVRGRVLLGHQVHAVTERRDEHDVTGAVQRDEFVERERLVQVVDHRQTDAAVAPVDLADQSLDLVAFVLVVLDGFARRGGHLDHDVALGIEFARLEQGCERLETQSDALGVVEPVDAEQDHLRVAQSGTDLAHALAGRTAGGHRLDVIDVDRDRKRADPGAVIGVLDHVVVCVHVQQLLRSGDEVRCCPSDAGSRADRSRADPRRSRFAREVGRTTRTGGTGCAGRTRWSRRRAARATSWGRVAAGSRGSRRSRRAARSSASATANRSLTAT